METQFTVSKNPGVNKGVFFGMLFHSRDYIHLAHLDVSGPGSFAAHKALNEFYGEILDIIDTLIESTQGEEGILKITIPKTELSKPAQEFLLELREYIKNQRVIFKESFQQNIIDNLQQLISQTIYKLKYLK
jgi:DNA-binding ferritin-like protein